MPKYTFTIEYERGEPIYPVDRVTMNSPENWDVFKDIIRILEALSHDGIITPAIADLQKHSITSSSLNTKSRKPPKQPNTTEPNKQQTPPMP